MFCQNCGTELKDSARFCPMCGKESSYAAVTEKNQSNPERSAQINQGPSPNPKGAARTRDSKKPQVEKLSALSTRQKISAVIWMVLVLALGITPLTSVTILPFFASRSYPLFEASTLVAAMRSIAEGSASQGALNSLEFAASFATVLWGVALALNLLACYYVLKGRRGILDVGIGGRSGFIFALSIVLYVAICEQSFGMQTTFLGILELVAAAILAICSLAVGIVSGVRRFSTAFKKGLNS